jgi:hypothetical protein
VTVVSANVLYCDSGKCICFVLKQRQMNMFCNVTAVSEHVLNCESGKCTCLYSNSVTEHALYCKIRKCTCFVL